MRAWGTQTVCSKALSDIIPLRSAISVALGAVTLLAWLFPREAAAAGGAVLPGLALSCAMLAILSLTPWPALCGVTFVLTATTFLGWNPESVSSTSHIAGLALGLLAMAVIARSVTTERTLRALVIGFQLAGVVMLALGLVGAALRTETLWGFALPRIELGLAGLQSGVVNPNALAAGVLLVAPVGMAALFSEREGRPGWLMSSLAATLVLLGGLILLVSESRSAWLAVAILLVGVLMRRVLTVRWIGFAAILLLAGVAAGAYAVRSGALPLGSIDRGNSVWERAEIMSQGVALLRESPWLGVGFNEFRHLYRPTPGEAAHAHNIVLQTALDVGLVGLAAYGGLVAIVLLRARETVRDTTGFVRVAAIGAAAVMAGVHLFGLADAVPLGAKIGLFQWAAAGIILGAWRLRSPSTQ